MRRKEHPAYPTAPFINASVNIFRQTKLVLLLLAVQIAAMGFMKDVRGISILVCTVAGVLTASLLIGITKKKYTFDIQAVVTGVFIGFFFPNDSGFLFSFIIAFISYSLSEGIFGGKNGIWIHPVMLAVGIASVSQPHLFVNSITQAHLHEAGGGFNAFSAQGFSRIAADRSITALLNTSFLHKAGVTLPEGYLTMLINFPSKIPAFRYNILTLASSLLLLSLQTIQKTLVFTFLGAYAVLVYLFPFAQGMQGFAQGDILYAWLTGGVLFSAFFIITNTSTLPRSNGGRFVSGLSTAFFAFFTVHPAASQAALPFAVMSANCLTPLIEQAEVFFYKKMRAS